MYIKSTYKNIIISLIQKKKIVQNKKAALHTILQLSGKRYLNKSKKKNLNYAIHQLSQNIIKKFKFKQQQIFMRIYFSGLNKGLQLLKKLPRKKFKILSIINRTPLPFNGCRGKKVKRR